MTLFTVLHNFSTLTHEEKTTKNRDPPDILLQTIVNFSK